MKSKALVKQTAPNVAGILASFLASRSPYTRQAYNLDLAAFAVHAGGPGTSPGAALAALLKSGGGAAFTAITDYKTAMVAAGLAPATVNRRLSSLRSIVKFCRAAGLIVWVVDVENIKSQGYRDTRGPGREGVSAMLAAVKARGGDKAARDRAIIRLTYDLGLRRGEIVNLDREHVDLATGVLYVLGKGRTEREARTLPPETAAALAPWLKVRGDGPGPLFYNFDHGHKGNGRLTGQGVYYIVKAWADAAGVKTTPHGLRHAAITTALDATGGNVREVQRFSRHADVKTVLVYDDDRRDVAGEIARRVAASVDG